MSPDTAATRLRAVSCGALVDRVLGHGKRTSGVVHAVFPSSVYVAFARRDGASDDLVVVHDVRHGHTPCSVLVERPARLTADVRVGAPARAEDGVLHLEGVVVDLRGAARQQPPRPAVIDLDLGDHGDLDTAVGVDDDAVARLGLRTAALERALGVRDPDATARAVHGLVGHGPGLTPSGDDALVGVATVLHRAGASGAPTGAMRRLLAAAVRPRLGRTTPISAHHLALALHGHSGEHLTTLVDEWLARGAPTALAVARVRAVGATSGLDALVGVRCGLRLVHHTVVRPTATEAVA